LPLPSLESNPVSASPSQRDPAVFPGSKSHKVFLLGAQESPGVSNHPPSAAELPPSEPPVSPPGSTPAPHPPPTKQDRVLLPGSKSKAVFSPNDNQAPAIPPDPPSASYLPPSGRGVVPDSTPVPQSPPSNRAIMHGSKSAAVFSPPPQQAPQVSTGTPSVRVLPSRNRPPTFNQRAAPSLPQAAKSPRRP
jgi:hypothetical protein